MRGWARRTVELHRELAAIADVDRWWWALAGGVAIAEVHAPPEIYLASDAEADADTFIGYRGPSSGPLTVAEAIRHAHAARTALRELDGELPEQPLAVTIDRHSATSTATSALDVAAFAIGDGCVIGRLDDPTLDARIGAALASGAPPAREWTGPAPFVCVAIGDEPVTTARHGHRRAWTDRGGPWLGLGRAGDLSVVSTCHLVVDGYGHARIAARIAELTRATEPAPNGVVPPLRVITEAVPLAVVWRDLPSPTPRVIPLAYAAGRLLHRTAGRRDARFSPTIQIPVARGPKDDPLRLRRRVVSATTSVRFYDGEPEPFDTFAERVRASITREAMARGLTSRLLAAARATPVPLAWKRKSIGAKRPPWMERIAEVIGGRALLSRIAVDRPAPRMYAVSSPSRLASSTDPIGGCVITIVDDGSHGAITLCGSGSTGTVANAAAFLDELLASV